MYNNQQEINNHKQILLNLINRLINTILINDEIFINNEIKKESEYLNSLLITKQNNLINQININNNINLNPFMFPPNAMMVASPMIPGNNNLNVIEQPQIINDNNINNLDLQKTQKINVVFNRAEGSINLQCKPDEKISEVIKKYREKTNDYNNNIFIFNTKTIDESSNLELKSLTNGLILFHFSILVRPIQNQI